MSSARRQLKAWLPPLGWGTLIFIGSTNVLSAEHTSRFLVPFLHWVWPTISAASIATVHFALRKLGHLTEYGVLAALLWRALRLSIGNAPRSRVASIALALAAAFAASDEFHQSFIPSRTAAPADVLIDCCGAALAVAICWRVSRRRAQT
jgi:VanZ family protein